MHCRVVGPDAAIDAPLVAVEPPDLGEVPGSHGGADVAAVEGLRLQVREGLRIGWRMGMKTGGCQPDGSGRGECMQMFHCFHGLSS